MPTFDEYVSTIRTSIMSKMLRFTDSEYYLLKFKPNPDPEEAKFLEVY